MKKLLTFVALILIASILGGIYGILHDQLTYTISPEYYTKFKFYQFGLSDVGNEAIFPNPRLEVCVVGFLATWWMGLFIGVLLSSVGFIHENWSTMFKVTIRAFVITLGIAFITGLVGLAYGYFHLADEPKSEFKNWLIPDNIIDFKNYISVGSMHNFSYLGGLIGLFAGFTFSALQWRNGRLLRALKMRKNGQHKI